MLLRFFGRKLGNLGRYGFSLPVVSSRLEAIVDLCRGGLGGTGCVIRWLHLYTRPFPVPMLGGVLLIAGTVLFVGLVVLLCS